ncbi:hypothetical protein LCGC14_3145460 [marine sediment metagenome]|uniref:Uncharacterized protein n=1 Tax=marine sediment metagenome TaxID=412755 RepID=A0A0F8Y2J6_9ZZZZ
MLNEPRNVEPGGYWGAPHSARTYNISAMEPPILQAQMADGVSRGNEELAG